ncbi:MAG: hypothetical protein GY861_19080 [bacterium]|nr:hypothetical protein [bacterium]
MFEEADKYIVKRMEDKWALLNYGITVLYENVETGNEVEQGEAHLELSIIDGITNRMNLGNTNRLHRYEGFININIYVEKGKGTRYAKELADAVSGIFRDQLFNGVLCRSPSLARLGNVGGWFQYTVSIPFQFDEQFTSTLDT